MRADRYLEQVRLLDARIDRKLIEKQRIMELATRITPSLSGMPRASGNSDKIGDTAVRLVEIEEQINDLIDHLIDKRAEIIALLETLPVQDYTVLHQYYIQGVTLAAIAENMAPKPMSERQVSRIKARAIKRVQAILDGREPRA